MTPLKRDGPPLPGPYSSLERRRVRACACFTGGDDRARTEAARTAGGSSNGALAAKTNRSSHNSEVAAPETGALRWLNVVLLPLSLRCEVHHPHLFRPD